MMLLAVLLMYFSHNLLSIYLLQIVQSLGGDSANLGSALGLQAAVEIDSLRIRSYHALFRHKESHVVCRPRLHYPGDHVSCHEFHSDALHDATNPNV